MRGGVGPLWFLCESWGVAVGWLQHKLSALYGSSPGNPLTFYMPDLYNPLRGQTKGGNIINQLKGSLLRRMEKSRQMIYFLYNINHYFVAGCFTEEDLYCHVPLPI